MKFYLEYQVLPDMILSQERLGKDPATDGELRQVMDGGVHQLHHAALQGVLLRPEL